MTKEKVIIIGDGAVGSSTAFALTLLNIGNEIGIIDVLEDKPAGDALDLKSILPLTGHQKIYQADYDDCGDADLVILTAGAPRKEGMSRLDLVTTNMKIAKSNTEQVMATGFNGVFLVTANPVDVLTYGVKQWSGLPAEQVIGTGTSIDTMRLQDHLSDYLGDVPASDVDVPVIGEHGDHAVPLWSTGKIAGQPALDRIQDKPEDERKTPEELYDFVRKEGSLIISKKGATYYGIAAANAFIARAVVTGEEITLSVGIYFDGQYSIEDVYLSLPARIGKGGVKEILTPELSDDEQAALEKAAEVMKDTIKEGLDSLDD